METNNALLEMIEGLQQKHEQLEQYFLELATRISQLETKRKGLK